MIFSSSLSGQEYSTCPIAWRVIFYAGRVKMLLKSFSFLFFLTIPMISKTREIWIILMLLYYMYLNYLRWYIVGSIDGCHSELVVVEGGEIRCIPSYTNRVTVCNRGP